MQDPENLKSVWPILDGDYELGDGDSPVAIAIIGRGRVELSPKQYCIKGTVKTENIGIEKIIGNIVSNSTIRFLIVCGKEEFGHFPGDALISLWKNGVDERMRIVGTRAAVPYLCNVSPEAIERFRKQVELIDLVYPKDVEEIIAYDPVYHFDDERISALIKVIEECVARNPGPFEGQPIIISHNALKLEGSFIGRSLNLAADKFASHMLRLSSEKLSTTASLAIVSEEFGVIFDVIDHEIFVVPSISLVTKIRAYLTGGV
ncbi:MAG: tetrahydromethanopterin S-methyltransferase subunit A [Methanomassiliicoccales archaeon]